MVENADDTASPEDSGGLTGPPKPQAALAADSSDQWPAPRLMVGHHRVPETRRGRRGSRERHDRRPVRDRRPRREAPLHRPVLGLAALILLGLLATFFAWVTAEPLWLAVGHGTGGTATVIHCSGHGLDQRCRAQFSAERDAFTADHVYLVGARVRPLADGTRMPARMVSASGRLAYAGDSAGLALRWGLGLGLTVLCGVAIALATGAHRLSSRRSRWYALLASVSGPLLLLLGMLVVTH